MCACTCTPLRVKGSNKTTVSPYSQCEGKCESHTLMLCSTHYLSGAKHTFSPPSPRCSLAQGAVTLAWPWRSHVFTVPPSLDVLLSLSLWQYVDKAVTDTSSQEGHLGSSSLCNAPPQFLINDKANPLALHIAPWPPEPHITVRKGTNRGKGRSKGKGKNRK